MPCYEYRCLKCNEVLEEFTTKTADHTTRHEFCPHCEEVTEQERKVSKSSFRGNFR